MSITTLPAHSPYTIVSLKKLPKKHWIENLKEYPSEIALVIQEVLYKWDDTFQDDDRFDQVVRGYSGKVIRPHAHIHSVITAYGVTIGQVGPYDQFLYVIRKENGEWEYIG